MYDERRDFVLRRTTRNKNRTLPLITCGSHRLPAQTTARGLAAAAARRGPQMTALRAQAARPRAEAAACVSEPSSIEAQGRTWSARSRAAWRAASRSRSRACAAAKPAARSSWLASRAGSSCVATMLCSCASARHSCGAPAASWSAQARTSSNDTQSVSHAAGVTTVGYLPPVVTSGVSLGRASACPPRVDNRVCTHRKTRQSSPAAAMWK